MWFRIKTKKKNSRGTKIVIERKNIQLFDWWIDDLLKNSKNTGVKRKKKTECVVKTHHRSKTFVLYYRETL
jgi:hypothetical protein